MKLFKNNNKLTILTYHSVCAVSDVESSIGFCETVFGRHLDTLKSYYNVLPLSEALNRLKNQDLPKRAICITFDDGYRNNATVALPMLADRGMLATFFVATEFLNGGIMFNDIVQHTVLQSASFEPFIEFVGQSAPIESMSKEQLIEAILEKVKYDSPEHRSSTVRKLAEAVGADLPSNLMMTSDQVNALADAGMEIGAHTVSHPILANVGDDTAQREIVASKEMLEGIVGRPIRYFAYPNGIPGMDFKRKHVDMVVDAGFQAAVTTSPGQADRNTDLLQIPRYGPWAKSRIRFLINDLQNARLKPSFLDR